MLTPSKEKWIQQDAYTFERRIWQGSIPKRKEPCPLDYLLANGVRTQPNGEIMSGIQSGAAYEAFLFQSDGETLNKCYSRFVSKIGESSQSANNWHEREQSVEMIVKRSTQMFQAFNALRKGRFGDFAKALGVKAKPKKSPKAKRREQRRKQKGGSKVSPKRTRPKWNKPKDAANLWLEYHFGWAPLAQDIYNAVKTLTDDLPAFPVKASAYRNTSERNNPRIFEWVTSGARFYNCRMAGLVWVSNPNKYYANKLGVLNPAAFVYEAIPFSFVVDWFASVGTIINSMTDFSGLSLKNCYTTHSYRGELDLVYLNDDHTTTSISTSGLRVRRSLGIDAPVFVWHEFKGFSLARGATAISLLVQAFSKHLK